ncbi:MAG TPA: ABC transporter ATP-binding protein, partial [Nevskiaceae bacterium]|nr:ABC transporter ATP-binding protein [Nevskiaceae bacterium]
GRHLDAGNVDPRQPLRPCTGGGQLMDMSRTAEADAAADTPTRAALRVHGLGKSFGSTEVLSGITLYVPRGEIVTVLGASGSGKTTLLRLICGFERTDSGIIELGSRLVSRGAGFHLAPEKRGVGYVAQEGALFPHLSVADNLLFGAPRTLRHGSRREREQRVTELLALMDLPSDYATRRPAELSGGQQQRIALARALAPQPTIVLLDEPFSALDAGLRAGTRAAVIASLKRAHATALLVTHDRDEALSVGDRVAVLHHGHLLQVDTPQRVYQYPTTPDVARFVGDTVLVPGVRHGKQVECCFGRLPLAPQAQVPADDAVSVLIRPEQFQLQPGDAAGTKAQARVQALSFHGHDAQLQLLSIDGTAFTASIPGRDAPSVGQTVGYEIIGPVIAYPRAPGVDGAT